MLKQISIQILYGSRDDEMQNLLKCSATATAKSCFNITFWTHRFRCILERSNPFGCRRLSSKTKMKRLKVYKASFKLMKIFLNIYQYIEYWEYSYYYSSYSSSYSYVTFLPHPSGQWTYIITAFLTAPRQLGDMPPSTMGLQSNLNKTPRFSFQRAIIRSDLGSEINGFKQIILFQMNFGC